MKQNDVYIFVISNNRRFRVTNDGDSSGETIFNGVPDWVYEGTFRLPQVSLTTHKNHRGGTAQIRRVLVVSRRKMAGIYETR